jgi:hypothetical protein
VEKINEYVELTEPKVHSTHANANQAEASSFAACCVGNCELKKSSLSCINFPVHFSRSRQAQSGLLIFKLRWNNCESRETKCLLSLRRV